MSLLRGTYTLGSAINGYLLSVPGFKTQSQIRQSWFLGPVTAHAWRLMLSGSKTVGFIEAKMELYIKWDIYL